MKCVRCEHPMMPDRAFRKATPEARAGFRAHRGRGLCSACTQKARRDGTVIDSERLTMGSDILLEECLILVVERGMTTTSDIAEVLGITKDALTHGIMRAAKAGDERAHIIRQRLPFMTKEVTP